MMATTLYEVTCHIPCGCADGRDTHLFWGHEKQYHASRGEAEAACERLREHEGHGCDDSPVYAVEERHRGDFPADGLGAAEWRAACRRAGVDSRAHEEAKAIGPPGDE